MKRIDRLRAATVTALLSAASTALLAQETFITFDNLAVGTVVTNQYAGVTFGVVGQSCGNDPVIDLVITQPVAGTSTGTRALSIEAGCPDQSPDHMVMTFDRGHGEVTFTLGEVPGTYLVRAYDAPVGGVQVVAQNVTVEGVGFVSVHRLVRLTRAERDIRRVEIRDNIGQLEVIDTLTLDCPDVTAPIAQFTAPPQLSCVCNMTSIQGSAYDPDGQLGTWTLHRRGRGVLAWTLIAQSSIEREDEQLAIWTTVAGDGDYTLRLRVTNDCDLMTETYLDVHLDKILNGLAVRQPTAGAIVGGDVCVDGTAADYCGGTFTVERRPVGGGAFVPIGDIEPPWVQNDPLGTWDTRLATPDGDYDLRVTATDDCGNTAASTITPIVVDNKPPFAKIQAPVECSTVGGVVQIRGTVSDTHLAGWTLLVSLPGGGWQPLAAGAGPVANEVLADWDTTALPNCGYTLRLIASDQAVLDCNASAHNTYEHTLSVDVDESCSGDADGDGDADLDDLLLVLGAFGLACP